MSKNQNAPDDWPNTRTWGGRILATILFLGAIASMARLLFFVMNR